LDILVKTLHGLEGSLAEELRNIGAENVKELKRAVSCTGNLALVYRANYTLRTALRVLIPLHTFKAKNENEFYRECRKFDWEDHIELRQTFAIDHSIGKNASLKHSQFASLKLKDAIVDHFRAKKGRRPSVNPDNPDILLNLHGFNDEYTISLDSSGKPLNQRGYRKPGHQAPLNEVLGAGLLAISGWDKKSTLLDPMCGSGTIALEAALMAKNIPVQILRNEFGFMNWSNFNAILWNRVKHDAQREQVRGKISIYASDMSGETNRLVKHSAKLLKLGNGFEIDRRNFLDVVPPGEQGTILTNPPYGERIGGDNVGDFYTKIGDKLKQDFAGWDAWLISSNFGALRSLRLGPSEKHILFNGKLECQFCKYEMYKGSKD
jgi:putative N6-adenine-specific DNA methylase